MKIVEKLKSKLNMNKESVPTGDDTSSSSSSSSSSSNSGAFGAQKNKMPTWKSKNFYNIGDCVRYHEKEYKCVTAHQASKAVNPLTSSENWVLNPTAPTGNIVSSEPTFNQFV
jgi:hypothetical protein